MVIPLYSSGHLCSYTHQLQLCLALYEWEATTCTKEYSNVCGVSIDWSHKSHNAPLRSGRMGKVIMYVNKTNLHMILWLIYLPRFSVSRLLLQFELSNGFQMMGKAWCCIKDVLCRFAGSSIKFQGHTGQKRWFESNLNRITRPDIAIKSLRFALF